MAQKTFKFLELPEDHGFDEQQMKLLGTIDSTLSSAAESLKGAKKEDIDGLRKEFNQQIGKMNEKLDAEKIQNQLDYLFKQFNAIGQPQYNAETVKQQERKANEKWLRSFLHKDKEGMRTANKEITDIKGVADATTDALYTGNDSQGGYLVPDLFLSEVNRFIEEYGVARREMRYLPFGGEGNQRKIPTLSSSVTTYWVDEANQKTTSKPAFGQVTQTLKTAAVLAILSEEQIEDTAINMISMLSKLMGEAIAEEEDTEFLAGDTDDGDTWDGVLNADGVNTYALSTTSRADDVTPDDFLEALDDLSTAQRRGGKWYMHPSVFAQVRGYRASAASADDELGTYLVQSPTGTQPASLWGYPVVLSDAMPSVSDADGSGDVDTPFAFFANLQKTCVYGDKMGLRVKTLDQATVDTTGGDTVNLAQNDMIGVRVHKRVGYVPVLPSGIVVMQTGPTS
jgi:HK97 family phage major capsid protein